MTTGIVNNQGLNLRSAPSMKGKRLDQLNKGDRLDVLPSNHGAKNWLHVRVRRTGQSGYVYGEYVDVLAEPAPPPAPVTYWPPDVPTAPEPLPVPSEPTSSSGFLFGVVVIIAGFITCVMWLLSRLS